MTGRLLRIADSTEIDKARPSASDTLSAVEKSFRMIATGEIESPTKIYTGLGEDGMAISMLASRPSAGYSLIKNYFESSTSSVHKGNSFAAFFAFSEQDEVPLTIIHDEWITAVRSAAVTSLMIRELAANRTKHVTLMGLGKLGRALIDFLPLMDIAKVSVFDPIEAATDNWVSQARERLAGIEVVPHKTKESFVSAIAESDALIATAGPPAIGFLDVDDIPPGVLAVYVGYGFTRDVMHQADRLYTTSRSQMAVTCPELRDDNGNVPAADREFHEILNGASVERPRPDERVFAYNSGLAVNDLAVVELILQARKSQ